MSPGPTTNKGRSFKVKAFGAHEPEHPDGPFLWILAWTEAGGTVHKCSCPESPDVHSYAETFHGLGPHMRQETALQVAKEWHPSQFAVIELCPECCPPEQETQL